MRLIDADALKDYLQSLAYDDWNQGVITTWADAYRECADIVDEQPTIETERKHGHWIIVDEPNPNYSPFDGSSEYFCECSECGARIGSRKRFSNLFCYHCGTDMREGEQDDE